jgi:DNA-binding transcriptional MerR regulator
MLTIGDFATFAGVSVRTLRFWDREDVLVPADVDPRTGYRRYTADQLALAHRIRAFQQLGFSLTTIASLLAETPAPDRMADMLRALEAAAEHDRIEAEQRLQRIQAGLRLIERTAMTATTYAVAVKTIPAVRLAMISESLGPVDPQSADYAAVFGRLFGELVARLGAARVSPAGPAWSLYDTSTEDGLVVHAAFPIAGGWAGDDRVSVVDRPQQQVASTIHMGALAAMPAAYAAVAEWIEANGLVVGGGAAEISHVFEPTDPAANVTELMLPLVGS